MRGIFWRFGNTAPVIVEGQVCLHIDYCLALRTERSVAHVFNAHIEFEIVPVPYPIDQLELDEIDVTCEW